MQKLETLIDMLTRARRIHISVLDIAGMLDTPNTEIPLKYVIHSKPFCDVAKSTERGYKYCLFCKKLANTRAINEKKTFCGMCLYGIFEAAVPVVIGGAVMAVVYVGNAVIDADASRRRMERAARHTGVKLEKLLKRADECEILGCEDELVAVGEIVADYLKMLYGASPKESERMHWLVSAMKRHAEGEYSRIPSLKELAVIYHKNEKYIGRLFEREMGVGYNKYCLELRLEAAERMLVKTSEKIIDVALECGFENISYFNRTFKQRYGLSPSEYRNK